MSAPLILVGCGAAKRAEACEARELYTGCLFADRRGYAEATGAEWRILSAARGLVDPDQQLEPYDQRLQDLPEVERAAWALVVARQILDELDDTVRLRDLRVEIHASAAYAHQLRDVLHALGVREVALPVEGLGIGQQRRWYAEARRRARLGLGPRRVS